MQKTARLTVRLMGAPQVFVEEISLSLKHLKSRALLFYLAATGQSHTREHLATLLWGESSQSEAYHSLRSSLYHLRKALQEVKAEQALVSVGEFLSLDPAAYDCDVREFQQWLAQGTEQALTLAVALNKGSLLQGFFVPAAPGFEDWLQAESARLNQSSVEALNRLAIWAEARAAWADAIRHTRHSLQIDPLAETTQQRLMRLYLSQGEAGLALRHYHQFEQRLYQELDIQPALETKNLYAEILRQPRGFSSAAASVEPAKITSTSLPFVGRDDLLHELTMISDEVKAGHGATVLIQGEGGLGKTRLLNEFTSRLISGRTPWIVLRGACSPFDDLLSHGPFVEALQGGTAEELDELLTGSAASVPDARGRFFWRVLEMLRSMSRSAPLLLFIDDLQWANSSTLNLFGFLSMRLQHLPILLVGTVQHADAILSLQRLITLGRRRRELHLLSLAPLPSGAVSQLLQLAGVDAGSVEMLVEWLAAKSAGNPFLLSEILAQLRAEMILKPSHAGLQLEPAHWLRWRATFSLPETAHDLVVWRLANISAEARNLLDVLAVATQPIPEAVLRNIAGVWNDAMPVLVDDLSARGLLLELPINGALTLPHYLLRETLLQRLSHLRRRTIHRQLAEALESQFSSDSESALRQIAIHAVAGEDVARARRYGMQLLPNLPHEYTGAETVDFVQHLHELLLPSASPGEMVHITRALGVLHQSLGHLEIASRWHRETLTWAQKANDRLAQAQAYFEMSELALMSIDYGLAMQAAQDGLALIRLLQDDTELLSAGRGHRLLGAALAMEGRDLITAEEHLQQAVTAHRQNNNQDDLCATLFELGNVAAQRGELQRALDLYDEAARVAEAGRSHYYLALARNNFAYHSLLLHQVEAATDAVAQGIKVAEAYDLLAALLHLYSTQGEIHLYRNQWVAAENAFQRGLTLAEELNSLERQAGYRGGLALAARGRNDLETARQLLEEALALIVAQGHWHLRTRLQLWLAETLFEQSRYTEARALLDEALEVARAQQRTLLIEQGARLAARLPSIKET